MAPAKSNEQKSYEADLALIAEAEEEVRAAEERKRKLIEARKRVEAFERKKAIVENAKKRADSFISDITSIGWTERDQEIIDAFPAAIAKQQKLDALMVNAADRTYWADVPQDYAKKLRDAAKDGDTGGTINPAIVLFRAAETLEVC